MKLQQAIAILEEYITLDRETRETEDYSNDFDKFCEEKCKAIETILNHVKEEMGKNDR